MASYVETTAVALRRGSTTANEQFVGVQGELVADLGSNMSAGEGTDISTTIRLHNGITPGGIPMARADFGNITTQALAENRNRIEDKNLAYADLSNLEKNSNPEQIVRVFTEYGFAKKAEVDTALETYAKKDMSNVDTTPLATSKGDKNLAYSNTSNLNTANLVDKNIHDGTNGNKPLAYADLSNVNLASVTGNFAKTDFSNVEQATWNNIITTQNLEQTKNKDDEIVEADLTDGHYPETKAVVEYVSTKLSTTMGMTTSLNNATSWSALYAASGQRYVYASTPNYITTAGAGFVKDTIYSTGIGLTEDWDVFAIVFKDIETNFSFAPNFEYGMEDLSTYSPGKICKGKYTVAFTSTKIADDLYKYTITSIHPLPTLADIANDTNFYLDTLPPFRKVLCIKATDVSDTGEITNFEYVPSETKTYVPGPTLTITGGTTDATITVMSEGLVPAIGGARLTKADLTNLEGMDVIDAVVEADAPWRIRHNVPIANQPSTDDYYRIVTAGLVADNIVNNISIVRQEIEAVRQEIPSVPTVGNGTITIKQGTATKGTFAVNQTTDTTITLDAPKEPVVVTELPASPDENTTYYILESE